MQQSNAAKYRLRVQRNIRHSSALTCPKPIEKVEDVKTTGKVVMGDGDVKRRTPQVVTSYWPFQVTNTSKSALP